MTTTTFSDLRVIVGEDEQLLAIDIAQQLEELGTSVVGTADSLWQLEDLAVDGFNGANAAVLDASLLDGMVYPMVPVLEAGGLGVIICSGYRSEDRPQSLAHVPWLGKPARAVDIARALCQAVDSRRDRQID